MFEWIIDNQVVSTLIAAALGSGLVALIPILTKRANLYHRTYVLFSMFRKWGMGYDIPIIAGKAEQTTKLGIFATMSDIMRAGARALAGQPEHE